MRYLGAAADVIKRNRINKNILSVDTCILHKTWKDETITKKELEKSMIGIIKEGLQCKL